MKNRYFMLLMVMAILLLLFYSACKKQGFKIQNQIVDCDFYYDHQSGDSWQPLKPVSTSPYYANPFYNPNNNNEIVCVKLRTNRAHYNFDLIIFNTISQTETKIDSSDFFFQPYWTKTGWIVYAKGWVIHKLKPSITSATPFIFPVHYFPSYMVDINNDNILYNASPMWTTTNTKLVNINGELLDSFNNLTSGESLLFYDKSTIISPYFSYGKMVKYNLSTKSIQNILYENTVSYNTFRIVAYNTDTKSIYFQDDKGLYQFDEGTNKVTQLLTNCRYNYAYFSSISSDNTRLLGSRSKVNQLTKDSIFIANQLIELNTNTLKETVLHASLTISTYLL